MPRAAWWRVRLQTRTRRLPFVVKTTTEVFLLHFALAGFAVIRSLVPRFGLITGARIRSGEHSYLGLTSMILLAWRLMPVTVQPHWNRETWESELYFTSRTLSGNKSLFSPLTPEAAEVWPNFPCTSAAKFISPAALCLGARACFAFDTGSRRGSPIVPRSFVA